MPRQTILTSQAPQPVGPYSQGVRAGDFLHVSAQLPFDPMTGTLIRSGVRGQTRRVMENIKAVVEGSGATLAHIVKVTVFLKNLDDFGQMNEVYAEFFPGEKPARSTVEVSRLPKDAVLAIDVVAYLGS
ncbi:MAG: RidA family protein [Candidatus Coatesbacteria bacterium]